MHTLNQELDRLVEKGIVSTEEALLKSSNVESLRKLIKNQRPAKQVATETDDPTQIWKELVSKTS